MRIFFFQLNPTIGAMSHNTQKILEAIESARHEQAELVIFPEMAICGYFPDDLLLRDTFLDEVEASLRLIMEATEHMTVIVGTPRRASYPFDKPLCNSAAVIHNKQLLGYQDKALLPTYDVFDERRYFQPAFDEKVWNICQKRVGITICEDIWPFSHIGFQEHYPRDPLSYFERESLDLLINISASPYSYGKIETRTEMVRTCSRRLSCPVILCNQVGAQDGVIFDGSSVVVSAQGETLRMLKSFEEDSSCVDLQSLTPSSPSIQDKGAELFSALVLGVRDYFTKLGFQKACVGLSGGVDSATVASIATAALGKDHVVGILLPSRYTSPESTEDAYYVADNLGIDTIELPIESIFDTYLKNLHPVFEGKSCQVAEENLQARIRGMCLMAYSNVEGHLVLNTSNKSEAAMGYTTLYGDSCGAISVIGDLLKTEVYLIAEWIMKTKGWIPPRIISKAPTAELRHNQKDSDSLPEYAVLDPIIDAYIVQKLSCQEIATKLNLESKFIAKIIEKIHQNEYKRRQLPFPLRVSEKAFGVGRKVPIVHRFVK
jgi:NAD+ synthase (glutamine-hydrolysing)